MKPWWERFPGRLDREIESLDSHGIAYKRDELAWRHGQLVLELTVTPPGSQAAIGLIAYYPYTFPYTRFEVIAPDLLLPRHQNPFAKNLCLMGRASSNWSVHDTLGDVLAMQLPKLMRFATEDQASLRDLEEPQGEPFTDFYAYYPNTAVLVDSSWQFKPITRGKLKIVFSSALPFRGAVTEILDFSGNKLAQADEAFRDAFPRTARGRWVRWEAPIVETNVKRLLGIVSAKYRDIGQTGLSMKRALSRGEPEVLGIVFPEEREQGKYHDAWLFLVQTNDGWHLARACRAGRNDIGSRAPELAALPGKRVTAIGLGSVGASGAIELARNGIGVLKLADYDFIEAGTSSRWPLGLAAAGGSKVDVIADFIVQNYPYTKVERFCGMIGGAQPVPAPHYCDSRDLVRLLDTDLILDATAEYGIQLLLSDLAAERGIAYICVSTTPGAWGGLVFRQLPGADQACWSCLQHAMTQGSVPTPLHDPGGTLQPAGCANATFTGVSVDIQFMSLMAVRTAIATLCSGTQNGYPDVDWNVAIATLRSPDGRLIAPRWEVQTIGRHLDCHNEQAHKHNLATRRAA